MTDTLAHEYSSESILSKCYPMNTNMTGLECFSKILSSCVLDESSLSIGGFNPSTLIATKTDLSILEIIYLQKHFLENLWRRNVDQIFFSHTPTLLQFSFVKFRFICNTQMMFFRRSTLDVCL